MPEWNVGAVVMMDALGFKGIWEHHSLDDIVDPLHLVERTVRGLEQVDGLALARRLGLRMWMTFLSDTIVMAFSDPRRQTGVVTLATAHAGFALHAGATDTQEGRTWEAPLTYRGAITFGQFYVEDRYLVGPAIDEAAEAMNRPEGAFVCLTESAREHFAPRYTGRPVATRWEVPMKLRASKDGQYNYLDTWVASPFAHNAGQPARAWDIAESLLATFDRSDDPAVARKRCNTETFLKHAFEQHLDHDSAERP